MAKKKALVVDDSKLARYVMKKMLTEYGMEVDTVESAEEALGYLAHQKCNIVFMDQMMPGMDGLEAVKAIKEDPETAKIPVMMYTSKGGEVFVGQARKLGAYGVMPKQVKPVELYKVLRKLQLINQQNIDKTEEEPKRSAPRESAKPETEVPIPDPVIEKALSNKETIEEIAQVAAESVDQHSFPAQVSRLLNEQTQVFQRELPKQIKRVLDAHAAQGATKSSSKPGAADFIRKALGLALAAFIVFIPSLLLIGLNKPNSTPMLGDDGVMLELQEKYQELLLQKSDLERVVSSRNKERRAMVEALEWAVNKAGVYGFNELVVNSKRSANFYELASRLSAMGFRGQVTIEGYTGNFCLVNEPNVGFKLATTASSLRDCKTIEQLGSLGNSIVEKQAFAFNEFISQQFSNVSEDIQISGTFHGLQKPVINYPSPAIVDTAGEWNTIARENNRIVITLIPENDWLGSSSD